VEINFTTEKVDKKLYEKLILKYIYDHYHYTDYERYQEQDKWVINIKKTNDYDHQFYSSDPRAQDLDFSIPHGVTGLGEITCYITDSPNNLITMQNMTVICHELAHMILMIYFPQKIVKMRNNDFHGKAGDSRKFFSCEVHDRVTEGRVKQFKYKLSRFKRFTFIGVDIEDITNSRSVRRV
jgi:hypothetical protein